MNNRNASFITLFLMTLSFSTLAQVIIEPNATISIAADATIEVVTDLIVENGGTLIQTDSTSEIALNANLRVNGDLEGNGTFRFIGMDNQFISGNLTGTNTIYNLIIEQGDVAANVQLQNNVEVLNSIKFIQGKIITNEKELYLKNTDVNAVSGYYIPNTIDGSFPTIDRFVEGNLARAIDGTVSTNYFFPIGNHNENYNPLRIENLNAISGKITTTFQTGTLGTIDFERTLDCDTDNPPYNGFATDVEQFTNANTTVSYNNMTGEGYWQILNPENFSYDMIAYPNVNNENINSSNEGRYRLLQRQLAGDVDTDWSIFGAIGNPCVMSTNYYELLGTAFNGSGVFAAAFVDEVVNVQTPIPQNDFVINEFIPNPAHDFSTLEILSTKESRFTMRIYNTLGQLVKEKQQPLNMGKQSFRLETSQWQAGIYFIVIEQEGKEWTKKLIIQ